MTWTKEKERNYFYFSKIFFQTQWDEGQSLRVIADAITMTSFTPRKYPEKTFSFHDHQSKISPPHKVHPRKIYRFFFLKREMCFLTSEFQCLVEGKEMNGERKNLKQRKNTRIRRHFKTNGWTHILMSEGMDGVCMVAVRRYSRSCSICIGFSKPGERKDKVYLKNNKFDYLKVLEKVGGNESLGGSSLQKTLKAEFGVWVVDNKHSSRSCWFVSVFSFGKCLFFCLFFLLLGCLFFSYCLVGVLENILDARVLLGMCCKYFLLFWSLSFHFLYGVFG